MRNTYTHPDLPPSVAIDALHDVGFEALPAERVSQTVLDTFDGRLHRAHLRLVHQDGRHSGLVLLGPDGAPPAVVDRAPPPRWPTDLPPGPLRERLLAVTKERALLPVVTIRSQVHEARLTDRRSKTVVRALVHDQVEIGGATGSDHPTWAVEVAPVAGHERAAEKVGLRLTSAGLRPLDGDLAEHLAKLTGTPLSGHDSSPSVTLHPADDALAAFRAVLLNLHRTIEANLPGTVEDIDPEFLHELRVAVRRTRSVLARGKGVLPPAVRDRYREGFGWLGQVTGPARDLDVYLLRWDEYVGFLDEPDRATLETVRRAFEARRVSAHLALSRGLRSADAHRLLSSWREWLLDPAVEAEQHRPIGPLVAKRIKVAQATVLRDGRQITPATPGVRLHDLRKDTKKLRYLLECFGGLLPSSGRRRFVGQLKALQENLGEHQDAEVHLNQLGDLARELHAKGSVDADMLLAMGRLSDQFETRRRQERACFAERFSCYDTKANRRTLSDLLANAAKP